MISASITFFISILAIVGMIAFEVREMRTEKKSWLAILSEKTDHTVHFVVLKIRTFFGYFNRRSAIALVQWIAYHILSWAREAYIWMHKKAHAHPPSKKVIDMVRGRGEINKIGGASFYLKNISKEN